MITLLECVRGELPSLKSQGYEEAITFSETILLDTNITLVLKREFDEKNLKVVEILLNQRRRNFQKSRSR